MLFNAKSDSNILVPSAFYILDGKSFPQLSSSETLNFPYVP